MGELESPFLAFESGKSAEFTCGSTNIGVIDVSIDIVEGFVAVLSFTDQVGHGAQNIEVIGVIKTQGVLIGDTDALFDFLINIFDGRLVQKTFQSQRVTPTTAK